MVFDFRDIAKVFDKIFPRPPEVADEHRWFLNELFKENEVSRVLDCACGTGFHVVLLLNEGYEVTGCDISRPMLSRARRRLKEEGLEAELVHSPWDEMTDNIDERFDAVICMGNALPLLTSNIEIIGALKGMYGMLDEGGILVIENRNIEKMLMEQERVDIKQTTPDDIVVTAIKYHMRKTTLNIFHIDIEKMDVSLYKMDLNKLTSKKMEKLLREARIEDYELYGDLRLGRFKPTGSDRLIVVARKEPSD